MTWRTRFWKIKQWWLNGPECEVDLKQFWAERTREEARDRRADDAYSKRYIRDVQRRIITGQPPRKTLIQSRKLLAAVARPKTAA